MHIAKVPVRITAATNDRSLDFMLYRKLGDEVLNFHFVKSPIFPVAPNRQSSLTFKMISFEAVAVAVTFLISIHPLVAQLDFATNPMTHQKCDRWYHAHSLAFPK